MLREGWLKKSRENSPHPVAPFHGKNFLIILLPWTLICLKLYNKQTAIQTTRTSKGRQRKYERKYPHSTLRIFNLRLSILSELFKVIEWVRPAACGDDSLARYIVDMLITDKSCTQDYHHIHYQTTKFNTNPPHPIPPLKKKNLISFKHRFLAVLTYRMIHRVFYATFSIFPPLCMYSYFLIGCWFFNISWIRVFQ